jgi:hypothetical protein
MTGMRLLAVLAVLTVAYALLLVVHPDSCREIGYAFAGVMILGVLLLEVRQPWRR